jgi:hypothetical protein
MSLEITRMTLEDLKETPPWEWPRDTAQRLLAILRDRGASLAGRQLAAELSGDYTVVDDALGSTLLSILRSGDEPDALRSTAAIALGPALEHSDSFGFEDPGDILISEGGFRDIQQSLQRLYMDATVPKDVRRSVLDASVRAPRDWCADAIRAAYAGADEDWRLTAVFGMRFVKGFEDQILEALSSRSPDVLRHAVSAAGNWQIDAAWPRVEGILEAERPDRDVLLAAIEAAVSIRPEEAAERLGELADSQDEDIADAAAEALVMVEALSELDEEDVEDDEDLFLR